MDINNINKLYEGVLNEPDNLIKIASLSSGFTLDEIIRKFEKGKLGKGYLHNLEQIRKASVIAAKLYGAAYLQRHAIAMVNKPKDYKLDANQNQVARHCIMILRCLHIKNLKDENFRIKEPELLLETIKYFLSYQEPIRGYAKKALENI